MNNILNLKNQRRKRALTRRTRDMDMYYENIDKGDDKTQRETKRKYKIARLDVEILSRTILG